MRKDAKLKNQIKIRELIQLPSLVAAVLLSVLGLTVILESIQPTQFTQQFEPTARQDVPGVSEIDQSKKRSSTPRLLSFVPEYQTQATKRSIYPMPTKSLKFAQREIERDSLSASMVVLDKVIVAPKRIPIKSNNLVGLEKSSDFNETWPSNDTELSLDTAVYTIQLLASRDLEALKQFAQAHSMEAETRIFINESQSIRWYVLTWGEYSTRKEAKEAIQQAPDKLAALKPWVRPLSDLNVSIYPKYSPNLGANVNSPKRIGENIDPP